MVRPQHPRPRIATALHEPPPVLGPQTPGLDTIELGPSGKRVLDRVTLFGLSTALGMILGAILIGGAAERFVNPEALLIVLGGTAAVTAVGFSMDDLRGLWPMLRASLMRPRQDLRREAAEAIRLALLVRAQGPQTLEAFAIARQGRTPFLAAGLRLVADGADPGLIRRQLETDLETIAEQRRQTVRILRRAAEIAPAMGLIGTIIGLVQMLGSLDRLATLGPALAVALLTTFYGALLGTVILAPLAAKLTRSGEEDLLVLRLHATAIDSIARGENPRQLEVSLNTLLPPDRRLHVFAR